MTLHLSFEKISFNPKTEFLKVDRAGHKIQFGVSTIEFVDKDTNQYVIHIPGFDVSGYGATRDKAEEMTTQCIQDFGTYLLSISKEAMIAEFVKLGWKHSVIKPKEFSKAFIDIKGSLNGFNAKEDSIKIGELEAA